MFNLFNKKKSAPPANGLYDLLFGDAPWEVWDKGGGPGVSGDFAEAHTALKTGQQERAIVVLRQITAMTDIEPRHRLQAWHFLRELGEVPPESSAKVVYGVVVEMPVSKGHDILAAYSDRRARYFNYSGRSLIWEAPGSDIEVDAAIDGLIAAGQKLASLIGPWDKPRLAPPTGDLVRLTMLTPSGLHFGQGPEKPFLADPAARSVAEPAALLMQVLVRRQVETNQS